jgi:AraC family transcriptional regulator, arabinose operon regulatory protein
MEGKRYHLDKIATGAGGIVFVPRPPASKRLTIAGVGHREIMAPGIVHRPHGTGDHLFMAFHSPARIETADGMEPVDQASWVLWRPGSTHRYGNEQAAWSHSWLHVHGTAVSEGVARDRVVCDRVQRLQDASIVEWLMPLIAGELRSYERPDIDTLDLLTAYLLRQLGRSCHRVGGARIPDAIVEARARIDALYAGTIDLDALARRAGMSRATLSAAFKRWYGTTPTQFLLARRMAAAAHHLLDRNLAIAEIARLVGIADPFYFSRLFRRHHGLGPEAYRSAR